MATLRFYIKCQTGNDASTGLSLAQAIKTPEMLAEKMNTVYSDFDFDVTYTDIAIEWYEYAQIPSGGAESSVIFAPESVYSDITFNFKANSGSVYGTLLPVSADGYQTHTLAIPAGCTIESVEFDPFMTDTTHVDANGFERTFGDALGSGGAVSSAPGGWYHDGSTTLHTNVPFGLGGYICVRYRPSAHVRMFEFTVRNLTVNGPSDQSCYFLYPIYKTSVIDPYAWYINFTSTLHDSYTFKNFKAKGCWHSIGLLDAGGSLAIDGVHIQNVEFTAQVVSDHTNTVSYNPVVIYTNNTAGGSGSPTYLDITDWLVEDCWLRCKRPLHWDGDTLAAGSAGQAANNTALFLHSHGGNAYCLPRLNCPATSGVSARNNRYSIDDYYCEGIYFAQRSYQSHTDTPHTDSAWGSFAEDLTIECWRDPTVSDEGTLLGAVVFGSDLNIRMRRVDWEGPDLSTLGGYGLGQGMLIISSASGADVLCELEECKISCKGNVSGTKKAMVQLGSATSGTVKFRARNCDFIQAATSVTTSIAAFDGTGGSTAATIEVRSSILHSNSLTGFKLLDDFTTGQLPLYGTSDTRAVFQNNFYSNVETFDTVSSGRDTAGEWRTGTDGPHDGTIADANGRDALYISAGSWNSNTRRFRSSDSAYVKKISAAVTLAYSPTTGLNGVAFNRSRGSEMLRGQAGGRHRRSVRVGRLSRV